MGAEDRSGARAGQPHLLVVKGSETGRSIPNSVTLEPVVFGFEFDRESNMITLTVQGNTKVLRADWGEGATLQIANSDSADCIEIFPRDDLSVLPDEEYKTQFIFVPMALCVYRLRRILRMVAGRPFIVWLNPGNVSGIVERSFTFRVGEELARALLEEQP